MEPAARRAYLEHLKSIHQDATVSEIGLHVDLKVPCTSLWQYCFYLFLFLGSTVGCITRWVDIRSKCCQSTWNPWDQVSCSSRSVFQQVSDMWILITSWSWITIIIIKSKDRCTSPNVNGVTLLFGVLLIVFAWWFKELNRTTSFGRKIVPYIKAFFTWLPELAYRFTQTIRERHVILHFFLILSHSWHW